MKLRNFSLAFGMASLELILSSASARALTLNFDYSYTDNDSTLWNGTGILSYDGSGNNQSFQITDLSFTESSGGTNNSYFLDTDFASSSIDTNNTDQVESFNLFGINVLGSGIDYRRFISGQTGPEASTVLRISEDFSETEDYSASTNFSPAVAVPWDFPPGQGVLLGLPLFIGLEMLKKKIRSQRKKVDLSKI